MPRADGEQQILPAHIGFHRGVSVAAMPVDGGHMRRVAIRQSQQQLAQPCDLVGLAKHRHLVHRARRHPVVAAVQGAEGWERRVTCIGMY
jgi:hypothetical protein